VNLLVLGNAQRPGVTEEAERLIPFLRAHCNVVVFDLLQERDLSTVPPADLALVLGGDGAILRAARQMGYDQVPVLGVNLGRLGFLADLHPAELRACFPRVVRGDYRVTRHLMFECRIESLEPGRPDPVASRTLLGLNEVVFHTLPPFHMLDLNLEVDGDCATRFSGDGLIVSTPIGSTAHSLSSGGPILGQELQAFVITPICPHTLTSRPVVDAADKVYTISTGPGAENAALVVDGQEVHTLTAGQRVTIRRAPVEFQMVKVAGHSFYQTLRDKLRWGAQPNYRSEP
jgi:NAD+ kinase